MDLSIEKRRIWILEREPEREREDQRLRPEEPTIIKRGIDYYCLSVAHTIKLMYRCSTDR